MANTVTGTAVVTGADGSVVYTGLATYTSLNQSFSVTHDLDRAFVKDRYGNDCTVVSSNEGDKLMIHLIPADTSGGNSLASAKGQVVRPPPNARVTLSSFPISAINGNYVYLGGYTIDLDNTNQPIRVNLP